MTVLVAYAPTDLGSAVLTAAVEEALRRGSDLLLVNSGTGSYADKGVATDQDLQDAAHQAEAAGVSITVRQHREAQSAAQTILDEAEAAEAELIVIGLRHRTRSGKFFLGSTSQTVLMRASCDVLAVKSRDHQG